MYTSRFRNTGANKTIITVLGILLNFVLFFISARWNLPLFLDKTGTVYTALLLGPLPALLVGFVHTLILVFFFSGAPGLWFYLIHILVAVIIGISAEERVFKGISSTFGVAFILYLLSTLLSTFFTFFFLGSKTRDYFSNMVSLSLSSNGIAQSLAVLIAVGTSLLPEIILTGVLASLLYLCTPSACKKY